MPGDAAVAIPGVGVGVDAAPDLIAVAHAAEAKGDLTRAIAAYEEVYATTRAAESLFRIADLYERIGATERAAIHFERYLDAAPEAPDRAAVQTRLAKLRAPPPPIPVHPSGPKIPTSGQTKPAQPCATGYARLCIRTVGKATQTLCKGVTNQARCSCESDAGSDALCPIVMRSQGGVLSCAAPRSADCAFPMDATTCNRFYFMGGTTGTPCEGYGHEGTKLPGKIECIRCTGTGFAGSTGEACSGFDGDTGKALSGVLGECISFGRL